MITIIDYGAGNLGSLGNLFEKSGIPFRISDKVEDVLSAKALILPGVGAAGEGMKNLINHGLDSGIRMAIGNGIPFLGICLGMQLLFDYSFEDNTNCLGVLKGKVNRFSKMPKIPQIGWNQVELRRPNDANEKLFEGIRDKSYFYFVNSYYCAPDEVDTIAAITEYGETFASVIVRKNIVATQFHPEKSGPLGFRLIKNFIQKYL